MILDFTVVTFQKEKQFYCAKVSYELLDDNNCKFNGRKSREYRECFQL